MELNLPLVVGSKPFAALCLYHGAQRSYHASEIELAEALVKQLSLAVQASRLAEDSRQKAMAETRQKAAQDRAEELTHANAMLMSSVEAVASSADLRVLLEHFLLQAMKAAGARGGSFTLYEDGQYKDQSCVAENGVIVAEEEWRREPMFIEAPEVLGANIAGFFHRLMSEKITRDRPEDARVWWPAAAHYHEKQGHVEVWNVACIARDQVIASFGLGFAVVPEMDSVQSMLIALAQQAALALELHRLSDEAKREAIRHEQEKAAQERAAELVKANEALQATADAIATLSEMDEIVPAILKIIARTFEGPSAAYYEIGADSTIYLRYYINEGSVISGVELLAGDGTPPYDLPKILAAGFKVSKEYSGAEDYRQLRTRVIDHRQGTSEPIFDAWRRKHNREMELNMPLMMGGQPLGVLTLSREAERPYTDAEIELAEAVVKQFCVAIQASRIAEDSRRKAVAIAIAQEQETAAQTAAAEMARANDELALRNRLLSVVADVSTRLARIGDIFASLPEALETIGVAGQLSRVLVLEERQRPSPQEGSDHLVRAEWCAPGIESHADCGTSVISSDVAEPFLNKLRSGVAFWCRLEDVDFPLRNAFERMSIKATCCAPLVVDGAYWGNVAFDDCVRPEPWDTAHVDALTAIAQAISNALQTRRDAERLASEREIAAKERVIALARANQSLRSGASVLSQSSSAEDVLAFVLHQTIEVTGADTATLVERTGLGSEFVFRTFLVREERTIRNASDTSRMPKFHLTLREDTYFSNLLQGRPGQITIDAEVAKRCPASEHIFRLGGAGVMWAFPFTTQGALEGYMALGFGAGRIPDSVGLETAEALACQASLVLETLYSVEKTKALEAIRERDIAVQKERTRLSEEMHDGLQQTMAAISLQVGSALVRIGQQQETDNVLKPLKRAAELAEQGLKEIRDSVHDLSAGTISDAAAFVSAVKKLCSSIDTDSTKCAATVTVDLSELPRANFQNIYRVLQEAAQNVVKHACARNVEIEIRSVPTSYVFSVTDDGCGIASVPAPRRGMGFQLMEERAIRVGGRLEVEKLQTGGTRVSLTVPKSASTAQSDPSEEPA